MVNSSRLQYISYSQVLFDFANKNNKVKYYFKLCSKILMELIKDDCYLFNFLKNNSVDKQNRKNIINDIFKNKVDEYFLYFLYTIIDFNRGDLLIKIMKQFLKQCDELFNIRYVRVYSPYELNELQLHKLSLALKKFYQSEVQLDNIVDASLIGGIKVVSDSDSIDNTFKTKLNNIKQDSEKMLSTVNMEGEIKDAK